MTDRTPPAKGGGAIRPSGVRYAVLVVVDGKPIELKEFLHDLIGGAIEGLLGGLRDVDAPREISVAVKRL